MANNGAEVLYESFLMSDGDGEWPWVFRVRNIVTVRDGVEMGELGNWGEKRVSVTTGSIWNFPSNQPAILLKSHPGRMSRVASHAPKLHIVLMTLQLATPAPADALHFIYPSGDYTSSHRS